MTARARPIVYVFVRRPVLGAVKSRLARDVGAPAALGFYRATTTALLRRLGGDPRWRVVLAVTPDADVFLPGPWPAAFSRVGQGAGDIGRRMARVLDAAPGAPAVLVGGDIPDVAPHHVARAFRALRSADLVFGPARDGGYWLVGRRPGRLPRGLFDGVRWSGPNALADTLANVPAARRAVLVDMLEDVDDGDALARRRGLKRGCRPGAR